MACRAIRQFSRARRRPPQFGFEQLEDRRLLAITWNIAINDPTSAYTAHHQAIRSVLLAAANDWGRFLPSSNASIELGVDFSTDESFIAAAKSQTDVFIRNNGSLDVYEWSVAHEIRTNVDPNGATRDGYIIINADYLTSDELWFDPTPANRNDEPVPFETFDAYSTLVHELGHVLGFNGYRDYTTGTLPANYASTFDLFVTIGGGGTPLFNGPAAMAAYGNRPVPLSYGNLFHVGNDPDSGRPGSDLVADVLYEFARTETRDVISQLDLAILQDAGLLQSVPLPPEIVVEQNGANIVDGTTTAIDFGSVAPGQPAPTRVFTVRNEGQLDLSLGVPDLPFGFTLVEDLASVLAPGTSDTFTVRLDGAGSDTVSGEVSISTNDADENPFNFPVTGVSASDGLLSSLLLRGGMGSMTVEIFSDDGNVTFDAWINFNQDEEYSDDEQIFTGIELPLGIWELTFRVPATALPGPTYAYLSVDGFLATTGLGQVGASEFGEDEDHLVTIMQDLVVDVPVDAEEVYIGLYEDEVFVEIYLEETTEYHSSPLAYTNSVQVFGSPDTADYVTVSYSDGFFALPGGIAIDGGGGGDSLDIEGGEIGSGPPTTTRYVSQGLSLGNAVLETNQGPQHNDIQFTNFDYLSISDVSAFEVEGVLDVGEGVLFVDSPSMMQLGTLTLLSGGTIVAVDGGISLGPGQTLRGSGDVIGRIAAEAGSVIEANGPLTLGDDASRAGFFSRGELRVGSYEVTLLDANEAVLGSLTTLGDEFAPGTLFAEGGVIVDFGHNVVGWGVIDTPDDVLQPVTNNGEIFGDFPEEEAEGPGGIALPGYVRGVGRLENVSVTGTLSPGFSPATVNYSGLTFGPAATVIAELGGAAPGSGYDQIHFLDTAQLDGTLEVQLLNDYVPALGSSFTLMMADGEVNGTFDTATLPTLPADRQWKLSYLASEVRLAVEAAASPFPLHNAAIRFDVNNSGGPAAVSALDALIIFNALNAFPVSLPSGTTNDNGNFRVLSSAASPVGSPLTAAPFFYDTSRDNFISAIDALLIFNFLNAPPPAGLAGEGMSPEVEAYASHQRETSETYTAATALDNRLDDLIAMLLFDVAEQTEHRRRGT